MKNILLPTDLTVQSLRAVHDIVKNAQGELVTIHVVHFITLPTSITDLIFIKQGKPFDAVPDNFSEAFQLLRNKYQHAIHKIVFDFIYCSSNRYFNNILEGHNIDAVYIIEDYNYRRTLPQSENIMPYLEKCKVPLFKLEQPAEDISSYQNLSALLNGSEQIKNVASTRKINPAISYS